MMNIARNLTFTILSTAVCMWLLSYGWQGHSVTLRRYPVTMEAAERLDRFPGAQYEIGYQAWFQNRTEEALTRFQRAVKGNIYLMDAWLKIGQIEAGRGNSERAARILEFSDRLTGGVYRWKWQQALLALDLNQLELFLSIVNDLIGYPKDRINALLVLDNRFAGDADAVMAALNTDHQPAYLDWLIRTDRIRDAQSVWARLAPPQQNQWELLLSYVHFLLKHKEIAAAKTAWTRAGHEGIFNPAFDRELVNKGFGWYGVSPADGRWSVKRVFQTETAPNYCVQVSFNGKENVNFSHFYQIVPVEPGRTYRLSWQWRSQSITTDQGPFRGGCRLRLRRTSRQEPDAGRKHAMASDLPASPGAGNLPRRRCPSSKAAQQTPRFEDRRQGLAG